MKLSKLPKLINISLFIGFSSLSTHLYADDQQLNKVVDASKKINQSASQSQIRVNQLNEKVISKLQQFKTINKEIEGLQVYNQQMQAQLNNQLEELSQLAISIEQVSIIERQISPLMSRMIDTLTNFVALDMPFLPAERSRRIVHLKSMLTRADIAVSEKFRRVLEAYQIETEYGDTIETWQAQLPLSDADKTVQLIRVGRVALYYLTPDRNHAGYWDNSSRTWLDLPATWLSKVKQAYEVADNKTVPTLLALPLLEAAHTVSATSQQEAL